MNQPWDDDIEVERLVRAKRAAKCYRTAARRALALARRYRDEEGARGTREQACVTQALEWRRDAHDTLRQARVEAGPGLARTRIEGASANKTRDVG